METEVQITLIQVVGTVVCTLITFVGGAMVATRRAERTDRPDPGAGLPPHPGSPGTTARAVAVVTAAAIAVGAAVFFLSGSLYADHDGPELGDLFAHTVVRAEAAHLGNSPGGFSASSERAEFLGGATDLPFACPDVDAGQLAVLTFEIFDVRTPRHVEVNGTLLPAEPAVLNQGQKTWDAVAVVVGKGLLQDAGNVLRVESRADDGGTTGNIDDFMIRNVVVLYKTRGR